MFEIKDSDAGLALVMDRDPEPRSPRLVEDPLFALVTWQPGLGDPHDWPDRSAFRAAISAEDHVIFSLVRVETDRGPVLMRQQEVKNGPAIGYAFASHKAVCLRLGLDEITPDIQGEVLADAEARCLGELQALDDYVQGEVYRYAIVDARGEVVEAGCDLYGEDYARYLAKEAFERHLVGVAMDG